METLDGLLENGISVDPTKMVSDAWCYSEVASNNRVSIQIPHYYILDVLVLSAFPYALHFNRMDFPSPTIFPHRQCLKQTVE